MFDIEQVPHSEFIWHPKAGFKVDKSLLLSCAFYDVNTKKSWAYFLSKEDLDKYSSYNTKFFDGDYEEDERLRIEAKTKVDKEVVEQVLFELNNADVILGWYSSRHDLKYMNGKAMMHGFMPVSTRHIDLYDYAAKKCSFSRNRLGDVARILGVKQKAKISPRLWDMVRNGSDKALKYIVDYNLVDGEATAEVYGKLKPLILAHPHYKTLVEGMQGVNLENYCRHCGSENLRLFGYYYLKSSRKRRHICLNCGKYTV